MLIHNNFSRRIWINSFVSLFFICHVGRYDNDFTPNSSSGFVLDDKTTSAPILPKASAMTFPIPVFVSWNTKNEDWLSEHFSPDGKILRRNDGVSIIVDCWGCHYERKYWCFWGSLAYGLEFAIDTLIGVALRFSVKFGGEGLDTAVFGRHLPWFAGGG